MMLRPFALDALAATPWKNGGGATREIVVQPTGAGLDTFDWRASVATIDRDGPFSAFPGIDRVIILLSGGGVHLQADDGSIDHRLDSPHQPFPFDGATALQGRLLGGTSTDFNLMSRRDRIDARVEVIGGHSRSIARVVPEGLVLALRGPWHLVVDGPACADAAWPPGAGRIDCAEGRGFWWTANAGNLTGRAGTQGPAAADGLRLRAEAATDDARLLLVTIRRRRPGEDRAD